MIAIIIVYVNKIDLLRNYLDILSKSKFNFDIIIIDNSQGNDLVNILCDNKNLIRINSYERKGFAAANNMAIPVIREKSYKRIVFSNYDIIISPKDLDYFFNKFAGSTKTIETILMRDSNYRSWKTVFYFSRFLGITNGLKIGQKCVSGCFLGMDTEKFLEINGFDESFFLYNEDVDLSLRCQSEKIVLHKIEAVHLVSQVIKSEGALYHYLYYVYSRIYLLNKYKVGLVGRFVNLFYFLRQFYKLLHASLRS
jgi:GT2 family glycosyltransferase